MKKIRCSNCVLDNSIQDVSIDDNGICNYCKNFDLFFKKNLRKKNSSYLKKEIELIKTERSNKKYDVIVGVSGGVDSSYVLYLAIKIYGLRVLALHVDTGWNSDLSVTNIYNMVTKLNCDLYTHVIDWENFRLLQKTFFEASVVNCDIPQDHILKTAQYFVAKKLDCRFFISGRSNFENCMMPKSWIWNNSDGYHIKKIYKQFSKVRLENIQINSFFYNLIWNKYVNRYSDFKILDKINYNSEKAKKFLIKNFRWKPYKNKHSESIFTEFYQSYYLYNKFKIDKRVGHLSSKIKINEISRNKAIRIISLPPIDKDREKEILDYFLKKLDFTENSWKKIMCDDVKLHQDYPNRQWVINSFKKISNIIKI
jgi:N-acetyl sugar amidotransferase